jgi:hypothetical protein
MENLRQKAGKPDRSDMKTDKLRQHMNDVKGVPRHSGTVEWNPVGGLPDKEGIFGELGNGVHNPLADYSTTTQIFIVVVILAILRFVWLFIKAIRTRIANENKENDSYTSGNDPLL